MLKSLCGKMIDFRLGEIIGLIHAREKRYHQNKTQLRYNFDSVYYELSYTKHSGFLFYPNVWVSRDIVKLHVCANELRLGVSLALAVNVCGVRRGRSSVI